MAVIIPATTYPDGASLSISNHNTNVFSTTVGSGVMSEPNGNLQSANLTPGFTVRAEHVMSEEAVFARADRSLFPYDVYNNAFGHREDETRSYVALGGLNHRVYLPYNASVLIWQWSYFISVWRPYLSSGGEETTVGNQNIPDLVVRVYFDGTFISAFTRAFPVTANVWYDRTGTADDDLVSSFDDQNAIWLDNAKMVNSATKGFHELSVRVFMPRVSTDTETQATVNLPTLRFSPQGNNTDFVTCNVHTRVTLGTRNVRAVVFR